MKVSYHTFGHGGAGVLAIDDESGYAVAVSSESTWSANRTIAETRLRTSAVLRDERNERDATIRNLTGMLAATSKACDALEDIGEHASARIAELERDHAVIVSLMEENERLKQEVHDLSSSPSVKLDEYTGAMKTVERQRDEIADLKARIAELEDRNGTCPKCKISLRDIGLHICERDDR